MKMASPQNITWRTILLIAFSFNLRNVISTQDSCKGRCASQYDRSHGCHCDTGCLRYGECCKDYRALCTSESSCVGRCFEMHERGRKCQCDRNCMKYRDCCPDFVATCERENPSAKVMEESTIKYPTSFKVRKNNSKILDKGIAKTSFPVDASIDSKILVNVIPTPSNSEDGTTESAMMLKILTTSVAPERGTIELLNKGMKMTTVTEGDSTNSKNNYEEMTTIPKDGNTDSKSLDKGRTTVSNSEAASKEPKISGTRTITRAAPEEASSVSSILDRRMTTLSTREEKNNDSKIPNNVATTVTESNSLNSKIANSHTTHSNVLDKGMTTVFIPQDASTDSKILDREMTPNTEAEEVPTGPRLSESVVTTSALPSTASSDARISDKGVTSLSFVVNETTISKFLHKIMTNSPFPKDRTRDSDILDNMITSSIPKDGTRHIKISEGLTTPFASAGSLTDSKFLDKRMTSVPEEGKTHSKTGDNRIKKYSASEDRSTDHKNLEGMITTTVPDDASITLKILGKGITISNVSKNRTVDSNFLDKGTTASGTEVTSKEHKISVSQTTTHAASEVASSVPGILDRRITTLSTPENRTNNSKIPNKVVTTTIPESSSVNSKISNNPMTIPSADDDISKSSKTLDNRMTIPTDYTTHSNILDKGMTTVFITQDASTDSKIMDRGMTQNSEPEEVPTGPRISESVMITSALPSTASTDARILDKGMTSLSVLVTHPTETNNMVTNAPLPARELGIQTTGNNQSYEDSLNDPNLCNKKPSNAMTTLQNGTTYIFRGHLFWTINQRGQKLGQPRRITDVWGIPSPIDTVFTRCNCNGKTYFFKGKAYWRFQNGFMDSGYPRNIAAGFSGLSGKITAALSVAAHRNRPETVYFFKTGGLYQKYVYQRPFTNCPQVRTHSYTYQVVRQRFRRQTMVIQKTRRQQKIAQLSVEMLIRKNWHGFPVRITSAISLPNPRIAEKYEYYVLSRDKSYKIDPVNQKATHMKRSVTKDLYKCN